MKVTSALADMEISVGRISSKGGRLILESGASSSIDARVAMDAGDVWAAIGAFLRSPSAWGFVLGLPFLLAQKAGCGGSSRWRGRALCGLCDQPSLAAEEGPVMTALEMGAHGSWADPLALEACLSDEERLIGATARRFAVERLAPLIVDAAREEKFDRALMQEMGAQGLLGVTLPVEYGGARRILRWLWLGCARGGAYSIARCARP